MERGGGAHGEKGVGTWREGRWGNERREWDMKKGGGGTGEKGCGGHVEWSGGTWDKEVGDLEEGRLGTWEREVWCHC